MKTLLLPVAGLLLFTACSKKIAGISGVPDCMNQSITELQARKLCPDPSVEEYQFQGKTVYVLRHGTCGNDMTDDVIDAKCQLLGRLGGFAGNTKINGEEFDNARKVRVVWKAP